MGWLRRLRWGWFSPSNLDKSGRICHPRSQLLRAVDTAAAVVERDVPGDDAVAAAGAGWRTPVDVAAVEPDSLFESDDVVSASVDDVVIVSVAGTVVAAAAGMVMVELGGAGADFVASAFATADDAVVVAACAVVAVFAAA